MSELLFDLTEFVATSAETFAEVDLIPCWLRASGELAAFIDSDCFPGSTPGVAPDARAKFVSGTSGA